MKKVIAVTVFFIVSLFVLNSAYAVSPGETYYTKCNIWYEDAAKPISVNYHKGAMIPVGTKVKIDACKGRKIKFTTDKAVTLTFVNDPKYSSISLQELFDRYFSKGDVWTFFKFNAKERANIEKGTIAVGMSKEAALAAYGYPPSHQTPNISSDTWKYWNSRFVNFLVIFKDNRVSEIERHGSSRQTIE